MGMHVSYPQYVRLRTVQREVIKMDKMIRKMVSWLRQIDYVLYLERFSYSLDRTCASTLV